MALNHFEIALIGTVVIGGLLVIPAFIYRAGKNAGRAEAMREQLERESKAKT